MNFTSNFQPERFVKEAISFCRESSVIQSERKDLKNMNITVEAIYEAGVLKPLMPLSEL
jgi:Protein of unknown function DUF104